MLPVPEIAKRLAQRGWYLFKVDNPKAPHCLKISTRTHDSLLCSERGKHPIPVSWSNAGTTNLKEISNWFTKQSMINLAIDAGLSGLLIIDEDKDGEFERLSRNLGQKLPETFKVTTGKGTHFYFNSPNNGGSNTGKLKKLGYQIDVRGKGGYVVAPGSLHANGKTYEAQNFDAPVSNLPEWLSELLFGIDKAEYKGGTTIPPSKQNFEPILPAPYEDAVIERELKRLEELQRPWTKGANWDQTVFEVACNLYELANSSWTNIQSNQVDELIKSLSPTDEVWGLEQIGAKLKSARNKTQGKTKPISKNSIGNAAQSKRELKLRTLSEVQPEVTEWLWEGAIPLGVITGIAGTAGIGKSTVVNWIISNLTRGTLPGDLTGTPFEVLIAAGEDDTSRQLVPRLKVVDANLKFVKEFAPTVTHASGQEFDTVLNLSEDLEAIKALLVRTQAKMLVLDPILSFVDGNPNQQREVRAALDPLAALARDLNIAVVVVMHFNKGHGVAGEKLSGSHVWRDALRSLMVMTLDQETQKRILTVDKLNYAPAGKSVAFDVIGAALEVGGKQIEVAKAVYLGESDVSVQDILDRDQWERDGRRRVADDTNQAIEFIATSGEVTTQEIYEYLGIQDQTQERKNLNRKLVRAVKNGKISNPRPGTYAPPTEHSVAASGGLF